MKPASLLNQDWRHVVDCLGGAPAIEASARTTKAFQRARGLPGAVALLRLVLAYCLRQGGLRSTAAWASAIGLADISNVALLNRLRGCGDWLAALVGGVLSAEAPAASRRRPPPSPDRCHRRAEARGRRPAGQRGMAHPQCLRSARRALCFLRSERGER